METIYDAVERSLQRSIEQYTGILRHTDTLVDMLDSCDYSGIGRYATELEELQSAARENDELWLSHFRKDPQFWQDNALFAERMKIIHSILKKNEELSPRLQAVMAVAKAEKARLSEGRVVVAGYNPIMKSTRQISRTA